MDGSEDALIKGASELDAVPGDLDFQAHGEDEVSEGKEGSAESEEDQLPSHGRLSTILGHKWILISCLAVLLIAPGVLLISPKWPSRDKKEQTVKFSEKVKKDNLSEETISPFFIPLPAGSPNVIIRIDCSLIWDGLAAVRFKNNKLRVRDRLYRYLVGLAGQGGNLQKKINPLENEMSRIIGESLGMQGLIVKIKKLKYL